MRIGFDLRPVIKKNSRRRGIGKYTYEVIKALLERNDRHDFLLYTLREEVPELPQGFQARSLFHLSRPSRLNWIPDLLLLPRKIRRDGLDVFHATEITSVPSIGSTGPTRVYVHVHDLIPFVFWEETVKRIPWDYACALKVALKRIRRAALIITDSVHSRKDIVERLGVPENRIEVIHLGCNDDFGPVEPDAAAGYLQSKYDVTGPFLFYVGGSDFRKNLLRLIKAFARIREEGYPGKLVLAGETFLWDIAEVREVRVLLGKLGLDRRVSFPGYVADADLPYFYSACDFFIFPSLYEGFGLPVLEAMKCGAPVLTSRASSIPEVAGDAAVYFEPEDEESIVSSFLAVYGDPKRCEELREKGFRQAAQFNWQKTAEQILRLYERV